MACNELRLEEVDTVGTSLFDKNGRRIPPVDLASVAHRRTRRFFTCEQPEIDHAAIHNRIARHLGDNGGLSVSAFKERAEAILERLQADERTRNLINAVRVPFFLPCNSEIASGDIGTALDTRYIPAVQASFVERFPSHVFANHNVGGLASRLSVAPGSRHEQLLNSLKSNTVVGYYLIALPEYSLPAAVEQMAELPNDLLLAGGVDTCAALVGSPDILVKEKAYPPLLWLSALNGETDGIGYHFEAYGRDLTFNRRSHLNAAAEYWANALVAID